MSVVVPADPNATGVDDLVADINTALNATTLAGKIVAETSGAFITLVATGSSPAGTIVVQGIPANDPAATVLGFTNNQTSSQALRLDLDYLIATYNHTFTPELNLGSSNALGFNTSAALSLDASATFQLALGIGLSGNEQFTPFLYDYNASTGEGTGLVLDASAALNSLNATASLGPLSVSVANGSIVLNDTGLAQNPASTNPAQIVIGLESPAAGTPPSGLAGRHTLTDPILANLGVAQADAHIAANLPIYLGTNTTGKPLLTVTVDDDLTDPLNPTITPNAASIASTITTNASLSQTLSGLASSIDAVLSPVLDGVDGQVLGSDLPLIGPGIAQAAKFLSGLKNGFVSALNTAADTVTQVEDDLLSTFGPTGLNWLQPIAGNDLPVTDPHHYIVDQATAGDSAWACNSISTWGAPRR